MKCFIIYQYAPRQYAPSQYAQLVSMPLVSMPSSSVCPSLYIQCPTHSQTINTVGIVSVVNYMHVVIVHCMVGIPEC